MSWDQIQLYGPLAIVALAFLLKLLRKYILWARKERSKTAQPRLKIYKPDPENLHDHATRE